MYRVAKCLAYHKPFPFFAHTRKFCPFIFASIYKPLLLWAPGAKKWPASNGASWTLTAAYGTCPVRVRRTIAITAFRIAPQAAAILDRLGVAAIKLGHGYKDGDMVFSTTGHSSPSGFSKAKKSLDARMQALLGPKFKPWRTHDLRRTCATGMEKPGAGLAAPPQD